MHKTFSRLPGLMASFILFPVSLSAQQDDIAGAPAVVFGDKAPYTVVLDHVTGAVTLMDEGGNTLNAWGAGPDGRALAVPMASVPPDRPVVVRVENANPLLYDYGVQSEVVRQAPIRSCGQVGSQVAKSAMMATMGALEGMAPSGSALMESMAKSGPANAFWGPGLGAFDAPLPQDEAGLESMVASEMADAEAYLARLEPMVALAESVDDSLRLVARLADGQPAGPLLESLRGLLTSSLPDVIMPADVPAAVRKTVQDHGSGARRLSQGSKAADDAGYGGTWTVRARELATRVEALDPATVDAASLAIQDALLRLDRALRDVTRTLPVAADPNYRRISVQLTPTGTYPEIPRLKEGVDLFTEPEYSLLCSVSVGFAFMDRPADYMERDGIIARVPGGEDLRTAPALLVHLGLPAVPMLEAVVGVGLGVLSAPDLYAGASLDVLAPIVVNAGWVVQRTRRLPRGSALGDAFPPAYGTVDEFPRRWGTDFFFGVSLRR